MRFATLSLHRLIGLGVGLLSAAIVLTLASVVLVGTRAWSLVQEETEKVIADQAGAERIVGQIQDQVTLAGFYVRDPSDELVRRFRARGDEVFVSLRDYLYRELPPSERAEVERLKMMHQQLEATSQLVFGLVRAGDRAEASAMTDRMVGESLRLHDEMDRLMALQRARLKTLKSEQRRATHDMYVAVLALCAASLGVVVVLARALRHRLLGPLAQLSGAASRLGAGDLAARVPRAPQRELSAVATSFNDMADRLQDARGELETRNRELADAVATLRRTQEEVVQAEKMTALGGMLAGLAHELNNPLASVLGYAEMLRERLHEAPREGAGPSAAELAEPIVTEALRARDLVRGMLSFSRTAGAERGPVSLGEALAVVLGLRRYSFAQANLALETEVDPGLWVVAEDQRLQQVLLNLVNNAYDALAGGGGTALRITATDAGEWVTVRVRDDGPGLAEPARVFDPFYTTKPVGEGTGLGLSLVHRMVTDFGGSIEATNAPEGGACFVVRLRAAAAPAVAATGREAAREEPRAPLDPLGAPPPAAAPAPAAAHPAPGETGSVPARHADVPRGAAERERRGPDGAGNRKPRVLVVDDEEPLRNLQRRILERMGVEVLLASCGGEAERVLHGEAVDAVVSDVKMPGATSGVDLYHWVSRERPELADRFIFVTGDVYERSITELATATPSRFLAKPFEATEYMEHVRRALAAA